METTSKQERETKHTPGPWTVTRFEPADSVDSVAYATIHTGASGIIGLDLSWGSHAEANVSLIAAAPDMRDALLAQEKANTHPAECEYRMARDPDTGECCEEHARLRRRANELRKAALAKATPNGSD